MVKLADAATLLIQDLERLPFEQRGWDNFALRLSQVMHGPVIFGTVDVRTGVPGRIDHVLLPPDAIAAYRDHYWGISPWRDWIMDAGQGAVAAGSAINPLPTESYENTEFYTDFLRPHHMHHGISARIVRDGTHVTDLAVLRPRDTGAVAASEQHLMRRLVPHVRNALRVKRLLAAAETAKPGLGRPSVGVLLTDRYGRILFVNPVAHERLVDGDALTVRYGKLFARNEPAQERLLAMLRRAVDGGGADGSRAGGDILLPRPPLSPLRLTVAATPLTGDAYGLIDPAAIILLRERVAAPVFRLLDHGY